MRPPHAATRVSTAALLLALTVVNSVAAVAHGMAHRSAEAHDHVPEQTHAGHYMPTVEAADTDSEHAALHFSAIAKRQTIAPDGPLPLLSPPAVPVHFAIRNGPAEVVSNDTPVLRPGPRPEAARAPPKA
ncbi:MAG TPA: hypothetical protein VF981_08330 [Gemmatimonadaceae bacterium]